MFWEVGIYSAKWWQFQNFSVRGFMGSDLVGRRDRKFHLHNTLHIRKHYLFQRFGNRGGAGMGVGGLS